MAVYKGLSIRLPDHRGRKVGMPQGMQLDMPPGAQFGSPEVDPNEQSNADQPNFNQQPQPQQPMLNLNAPAQQAQPQDQGQGLNLQGPPSQDDQQGPTQDQFQGPGAPTSQGDPTIRDSDTGGKGFNWGHALMAISGGLEHGTAAAMHRPSQLSHMLQMYTQHPLQVAEQERKAKETAADISLKHEQADKYHFENSQKTLGAIPFWKGMGEPGKALLEDAKRRADINDPGSSRMLQNAWDDPKYAQTMDDIMDKGRATHGDAQAETELSRRLIGVTDRAEYQRIIDEYAKDPAIQKPIVERNLHSVLQKMPQAQQWMQDNKEDIWEKHQNKQASFFDMFNEAPNIQVPGGGKLFNSGELHAINSVEGIQAMEDAGYDSPALQAHKKKLAEDAKLQRDIDPFKDVKSGPEHDEMLQAHRNGEEITFQTAHDRVLAQAEKKAEVSAAGRLKAYGHSEITEQNKDLHGEAFISTLHPRSQVFVRGLIDHTIDPKTFASREGFGMSRPEAMAIAKQADPTFDQRSYDRLQKNWKEFTSPNGKTMQVTSSIDMTFQHLDTLRKLEALRASGGAGDIPALNAITAGFQKATGGSGFTNFDAASQAVATELMRVFRQVNASEEEIKEWKGYFDKTKSPQQILESLGVIGHLLDGRIQATENIWHKSMETSKDYDILSPEGKAASDTLHKLAPMGLNKEAQGYKGNPPNPNVGNPGSSKQTDLDKKRAALQQELAAARAREANEAVKAK